MAQAGIALAKIPLASPQPTAPPHRRDLARQLYQRQQTVETCGWVDSDEDNPYYCPVGSVCAYNTAQSAAFCCDSSSFPSSCTYATTCYDSTAVAGLCRGSCLDDPAVTICTLSGNEYCQATVFYYSTLGDTPVTNWDCGPEQSQFVDVYDEISFAAASSSYDYESATAAAASGPLITAVVSSSTLTPSSSGSISTSALPGPTTTSSTSPGPGIATPTAVPPPSHKSGLSGGAIAGIVVGVIFLFVLALGMILLYRYLKGRNPPPRPPPQLAHDTIPQPTNMAAVQPGSPNLSNAASNFTMPSNAPLYSPAMNELSPEDSKVGSYPTSHTAVGTFPQFSIQHDGQPPASPRTEFGSMTPVNAPDMNPEYTFVPKEPQQ